VGWWGPWLFMSHLQGGMRVAGALGLPFEIVFSTMVRRTLVLRSRCHPQDVMDG